MVDNVPLLHTTQILPLNQQGELVEPGNAARQIDQVMANLAEILSSAGTALSNVIKLNFCLSRTDMTPLVQQILAKKFADLTKPAVSFVVGDLPNPAALVAMDAIAVVTNLSSVAEVKQFRTTKLFQQKGVAQAALLPVGGRLYVSGMADTNNLAEATGVTLKKLFAALQSLGSRKADIVQLRIFLQPMSEVAAVRNIITSFFDGETPPLVFIEWISPGPNPPIEIELIAAAKGDFSKEPDSVTFLTPPGTTASKVFSRAVRVNHGKLLFFSSLYGSKSEEAAGQLGEMFQSLGTVLQKNGSDFRHLVKATYFVTDNEASDQLNEIRPRFYDPQRPPAASKAKVKGVGIPGRTVSFDMIAITAPPGP
jgi:enamine deaminase RidA (YjgF/YER057c/UK114 family)